MTILLPIIKSIVRRLIKNQQHFLIILIKNGFKADQKRIYPTALLILPMATSLGQSFMLPTSSPSNVLVFSKGNLTFKDMVHCITYIVYLS